MIRNLKLTRRRKLLAAVIICVILITGSTMLWQMGQVAEAAILEPHYDGLVGWWRFDEGSGTVAEDSSGSGNDGTICGATWVDGKYGKALSFDGENDWIDFGDIDDFEGISALTATAWVKFKTLDGNQYGQILVGKGDVSRVWNLDFRTDYKFRMCVKNADLVLKHATSTTTPVTDTWYFVAGTYDGSNTRIFVNGIEEDSEPQTGNIQSNTEVVAVGSEGQSNGGTWGFVDGVIDEVRIYNRALSADEIRDNFEKGPDFSSGLRANLPKGTTQFIVTLSWQGTGSIIATIESPSETYTEDVVPVYQKTIYSSSSGDMSNIKRIAVSVTALVNDESWYIILELNNVEDYKITVEVQR